MKEYKHAVLRLYIVCVSKQVMCRNICGCFKKKSTLNHDSIQTYPPVCYCITLVYFQQTRVFFEDWIVINSSSSAEIIMFMDYRLSDSLDIPPFDFLGASCVHVTSVNSINSYNNWTDSLHATCPGIETESVQLSNRGLICS